MARSKVVTQDQRQKIVNLKNHGKKLGEISAEAGLSINACYQALKHFKLTGSCLNKIRTQCRKTSSREDGIIRRISEADRHKTAVDIHEKVASQLSSPITVRTVQNRLNEFGLMGRVASKKTFYFQEK